MTGLAYGLRTALVTTAALAAGTSLALTASAPLASATARSALPAVAAVKCFVNHDGIPFRNHAGDVLGWVNKGQGFTVHRWTPNNYGHGKLWGGPDDVYIARSHLNC